jgi:hypothetical protein
MVRQILIESEPPDDSQTVFRLHVDANLIAEGVTAVEAQILVCEVLERIAVLNPAERPKKIRWRF